jgi:Ca2+/Na+ antiporter
MDSTDSILTISVEIIGVGLLALLAGADDDMGKLLVVFMAGLWAVFMITNPQIVAKIASFPGIAQQKAG